jgi:hypothetical protein
MAEREMAEVFMRGRAAAAEESDVEVVVKGPHVERHQRRRRRLA